MTDIAEILINTGRYGDEPTTIKRWVGCNKFPMQSYFQIDVSEVIRLAEEMVSDFGRVGFQRVRITVHNRGVGAAVVDQLRTLGYEVTELTQKNSFCSHCGQEKKS